MYATSDANEEIDDRHNSYDADEGVKGKEQKGLKKREVPERGRDRKRHVREKQILCRELEGVTDS